MVVGHRLWMMLLMYVYMCVCVCPHCKAGITVPQPHRHHIITSCSVPVEQSLTDRLVDYKQAVLHVPCMRVDLKLAIVGHSRRPELIKRTKR